MDFAQLLDQAIEVLQRCGRLTSHTLKWQFDLDEKALEDLAGEEQSGEDRWGRGYIRDAEPWTGQSSKRRMQREWLC